MVSLASNIPPLYFTYFFDHIGLHCMKPFPCRISMSFGIYCINLQMLASRTMPWKRPFNLLKREALTAIPSTCFSVSASFMFLHLCTEVLRDIISRYRRKGGYFNI